MGVVCLGRGRGPPHLQLSMPLRKMEDEFTEYWIFM